VVRQNEKNPVGLIPGMELKRMSFEKGDALAAEIQAFTSCVTSRTAPEVSGKVGREALKIVLHIMDQIQLMSQRL
jgi:hypothetical protein